MENDKATIGFISITFIGCLYCLPKEYFVPHMGGDRRGLGGASQSKTIQASGA